MRQFLKRCERQTHQRVQRHHYCSSRELTLNTTKTQFLIIKRATKRLPDPVVLTLNGINFPALTSVKLLGVTIDRHLTFAEHVRNTVTKCNGLLGVLRRAAPSLSKDLLRLAYMALVRTHLEYSSGLFVSAARTHLTKLEIVQKIASRIICDVPRNTHSAPLLEELRLESLDSRRVAHVCQIVTKCLRGHIYPAFLSWFSAAEDGQIYITTQPTSTSGRKRFKYAAAVLYNEQHGSNT